MTYTGTCPVIIAVRDHAVVATVALAALVVLCVVLFVSRDGSKSGFAAGGCAARRCQAGTCRGTWDPAASAEAQGLATVGAANFQHSSQAEQSLQMAINSAQ
jgi:hypothetical protein